MFVGV